MKIEKRAGPKDCWLITGIPGVGKSTVSRLLSARMGRGIHIEGDLLQEWIISDSVWPGEEPDDEAERQIKLNAHNQCLLAGSFSQAGFVPVMDYVITSRERLELYHDNLLGLTLHVVVLAPGVNVALSRDLERPGKTVAADWTYLEPEIKAGLGGNQDSA